MVIKYQLLLQHQLTTPQGTKIKIMTRQELETATPEIIAANYADAYAAIRANRNDFGGHAVYSFGGRFEISAVCTHIEMHNSFETTKISSDGTVETFADYYQD